MFYKLSNTANKDEIEDYFKIPMRYPELYEPNEIIDGLKESNLLIRTMERKENLQLGIWGLLPEKYQGSWKTFQKIKNTLNFNVELLKQDSFFKASLYSRRCLILVTGFFTTYLKDGKIHPYFVHLNSHKPFCLAGIYNRLEDGFITCSLLVSNNFKPLKKIQNLTQEMPLLINKSDSEKWLDNSLSKDEVHGLMHNNGMFLLNTYPISNRFYKNQNYGKDILNRAGYKSISNNN